MINIALVDDEKSNLDSINAILKKYFTINSIKYDVTLYQNPQNLVYDIEEKIFYDICLLDIEMPQVDGIKLAKIISSTHAKTYIIFITSHLQYAIIGYELKVSRYIPKSMIEQKLPQALDAIIKEIRVNDKGCFIIKTNVRYEKVYYNSIYYIYKDQKNSIFVTKSGESKIRMSLHDVYNELNQNIFLIIDRSYIVNFEHVMKIQNNLLYLRSGDHLSVSRSRSKEVKRLVNKYWSKYV